MGTDENKFIITGTPGSGKTTLIRALQQRGFTCVDEPARLVLAEQRAANGLGIPETNPKFFVELMLDKAIASHASHGSTTAPIFFDRGVPDNAAYASLFGVSSPSEEEASVKYRYNPVVLLAPPWREIYVNDTERKMTFELAEGFSTIIARVYLSFGYKLIELPRQGVDERVRFVIATVESALGRKLGS